MRLVCLPMDDIDENAHLVNALQRFAAVVVQKSLVEGFGLTVTEPMWKARAVLASAVGGIQDQVEHGVSGVLLPDPRDLEAFAGELAQLLAEPALRAELGAAARERVRAQFLGDRHLIQYVELFGDLPRVEWFRGSLRSQSATGLRSHLDQGAAVERSRRVVKMSSSGGSPRSRPCSRNHSRPSTSPATGRGSRRRMEIVRAPPVAWLAWAWSAARFASRWSRTSTTCVMSSRAV